MINNLINIDKHDIFNLKFGKPKHLSGSLGKPNQLILAIF